jgi:protein SDA1
MIQMQYKHYESELDIFKLRPTFDSQRFTDLITFMSHVGPCYKTECQQLPLQMMELMETNANSLHPDVRFKLFQCLVQLHNKDMIDPVKILQLAFKLFSVQDKNLRIAVGDFIINDIKGLNKNKNNEKVNRKVQALLFDILAEDTTIAARKTIYILSELYRRKIWTDSRTVNVIASACKSNSTRVMIAALNFFLGIENRMHEVDLFVSLLSYVMFLIIYVYCIFYVLIG